MRDTKPASERGSWPISSASMKSPIVFLITVKHEEHFERRSCSPRIRTNRRNSMPAVYGTINLSRERTANSYPAKYKIRVRMCGIRTILVPGRGQLFRVHHRSRRSRREACDPGTISLNRNYNKFGRRFATFHISSQMSQVSLSRTANFRNRILRDSARSCDYSFQNLYNFLNVFVSRCVPNQKALSLSTLLSLFLE